MRPEPPHHDARPDLPDKEPAAVMHLAELAEHARRAGQLPTGLTGAEFVEIVESLHRELEGQRARQRLHSVIEQAKGILVAQHGISLTQAFDRLRVMSQEHNVRLVEVAATLVGANLPPGERLELDLSEELPAPSPSESMVWSRMREDAGVRAGTSSALFDARAQSDPSQAGKLLRAVCTPLTADGAALYRLTIEQRLALVTAFGYSASLISAWQSIPPGVDLPAMRAAVTGQMVAIRDRAERARLFPRLLSTTATSEALIAVPVLSGEAITGVLELSWNSAQDSDPEILARAAQLAHVAGPVLLRAAVDPEPERRMLHAVLDAMFDPWLLAYPINEDDQAHSLRIRAASRELPDASDLVGRRILEIWPAMAVNDVLSHLNAVLHTGQPWVTQLTADQAESLPAATTGTEMRAVRVGSSLLMLWH